MRRYLSAPVGLGLPILVIAAFVLLLSVSAAWRSWQEMKEAEAAALVLVRERLSREQNRIQQMLHRREPGWVAEELSHFGATAEILALALVDEHGRVLFSKEPLAIGRLMEDGLPEFDAARLHAARRDHHLAMEFNDARTHLLAYQPIGPATPSGQIRQAATGGLLLKYDMAPAMAKARREVEMFIFWQVAFGLLVIAALLLTMRRWFSQPLAYLRDAVNRISRGDLVTRVEVHGRGELADLGAAVSRMQLDLSLAAAERDQNLAASRMSEQRLRAIFEAEPECVKVIGSNGDLLMMNAAGLAMLEADSVDDLNLHGLYTLVVPEYRATFATALHGALHGVASQFGFEITGLRGTRLWLETHMVPLWDEDGRTTQILAVTRDITQRKQAEDALRQSEEQSRALLSELQVGVVVQSPTSEILSCNPRALELLGLTEAQLMGKTSFDPDWNIVHADGTPFPGPTHPAPQAIATRQPVRNVVMGVYRPTTRSRVWLYVNAHPLLNSDGSIRVVIATFDDMSERLQAEQALQISLREKEALLKEVHHRVKNNLQVISSLLRLEAGRSEETGAKAVLSDMQGRIFSMALLHESLYRSGTFAAVDLASYLAKLADEVFRTQAKPSALIRLQLELASSVQVEMDRALPCGLLLNELLSNCLKHGFPGGAEGEIRIELRIVDDGRQLRLQVSDTGIGLPADFESRRRHSLGLQLVSDLAKQLHGRLCIGSGSGAEFTIIFPVNADQAQGASR